MCQSLVDKVAQSRELAGTTDPEIWVLFEDWYEELKEEILAFARDHRTADPERIARVFKLSRRGAAFLVKELQREGKLSGQPQEEHPPEEPEAR